MPKVYSQLTDREANILAGAKSVVQAVRAELAHERAEHELTRGDLRRANDRITELEAAVGFLISDEPPTSPAIPAAMKAASEQRGTDHGS